MRRGDWIILVYVPTLSYFRIETLKRSFVWNLRVMFVKTLRAPAPSGPNVY